ncbi:MAG: hypothetical protein ACYC6X_03100 [Minisyncoccota bacterium]
MIRIGFPLFFFICLACSVLAIPSLTSADTTTDIQSEIDANTSKIKSLEADIAAFQQQLDALGKKKNTLRSTISSLTLSQEQLAAQIKVTQNKIASANLQIQRLTGSISDKEVAIVANRAAIAKVLRGIAEGEQTPLISALVSSNSLQEAWLAADQAVQFNRALAEDIDNLSAARTTLTTNRDRVTAVKSTLVSLQSDLTNQRRSVNASKSTEQRLLVQTNNSESTYQKLLATAKAELASFSTFTTNAGGSKLLANQTSCDAWGCYYSQRDTLWGNVLLSGTNQRLAADGCLVTSMAMLMTHYGYHDVTPVTINADPENFSAVGGLLLFTIHVDGVSATRVRSFIDATLASGNPVVVGIHWYGGTHFVVFTSGSRGKYLMRDPYIANAKDVSFVANYPLSSIFSASKVVITK